jgi:hypothetical protein
MPDSSSPPPISRTALDRVLARAAELQAGSPDEPGDALTEAQVLELGNEAGIDPSVLRQALAEERARVVLPVERGFAARVAGPAHVAATRIVAGTPESVLRALDAWMQQAECMQVVRRLEDRATWEARRGFVGNLTRGLNLAGRSYQLCRARQVAAMVSAVDARRTLVRLDADLSTGRDAQVRVGGATAGVGVSASGVLGLSYALLIPHAAVSVLAAAAATLVTALPGAFGILAGFRLARRHLATAERAQLALEQVLDHLESGQPRGAGVALLEAISAVAKQKMT